MQRDEAVRMYATFLMGAVRTKAVWTLECEGDLVALSGMGPTLFPIWAEAESAQFFRSMHWPDLLPRRLGLRRFAGAVAPALARSRLPVGVGVAPNPEAVVVPARQLLRDLRATRRVLRAP